MLELTIKKDNELVVNKLQFKGKDLNNSDDKFEECLSTIIITKIHNSFLGIEREVNSQFYDFCLFASIANTTNDVNEIKKSLDDYYKTNPMIKDVEVYDEEIDNLLYRSIVRLNTININDKFIIDIVSSSYNTYEVIIYKHVNGNKNKIVINVSHYNITYNSVVTIKDYPNDILLDGGVVDLKFNNVMGSDHKDDVSVYDIWDKMIVNSKSFKSFKM